MSDRVTMNFKNGDNKISTERGQWCNICRWVNGQEYEDKLYLLWYRNDKAFVKANGKRKSFHKGSNSSNHIHICQHYSDYKERCEKADIPMHHWAIPPNVHKATKAVEVEAARKAHIMKKRGQQQLGFQTMISPCEFTRAGTLHAVANLITTNNQVVNHASSLAELITHLL